MPWGREVELFQASGRQTDLSLTPTELPLRESVLAFLALPQGQQGAAEIGLHEPFPLVMDGREAFVGWYNAEACDCGGMVRLGRP